MTDETPSRGSQHRAEEYEPVWESVLGIVDRQLAAGERKLSRAVSKVYFEWRGDGPAATDGVAFGERIRLPRNALFGARQSLIGQTLLDACRADTVAVVEFGSGAGLNLCDLFCRGGPAGARYFGLELTRNGRACLDRLAALDPDFACESRFFDFNAPDFGFLEGIAGHVLVYSVHAIEQIPRIGHGFFRSLVAATGNASGVHVEPIGWQVEGHSGAYSTQEYARSNGYNEDLLVSLRALHDEGLIELDTVVPDLFSQKLKNASTLLRWSTR